MLSQLPYYARQATHGEVRWNQILDFVKDGQVLFGFQSFDDNLLIKLNIKTEKEHHLASY